jgi:hypothetical protein
MDEIKQKEKLKSVGIHEDTHKALTKVYYELKAGTYEGAIKKLIVFWNEHKQK